MKGGDLMKAEDIKKARWKYNLSQQELADLAKVSIITIQKAEREIFTEKTAFKIEQAIRRLEKNV